LNKILRVAQGIPTKNIDIEAEIKAKKEVTEGTSMKYLRHE